MSKFVLGVNRQLRFWVVMSVLGGVAAAQELKTLRPEHPRLMVVKEDWVRMKNTIETDALAGRWYQSLLTEAEGIVAEKPVERVFRGGRTLLDESRRVLRRATCLAAIHRLSVRTRFVISHNAGGRSHSVARPPAFMPSINKIRKKTEAEKRDIP